MSAEDNPADDHYQLDQAIAEIRTLQADKDELIRLNDKLAKLLQGTADALKGQPAELERHDWSDLPRVAAQLRTEVRRLRREKVMLGIHMQDMRDDTRAGVRPRALYLDPLPTYGDVQTVQEFKASVESGLFIDYDGHGQPVRDGLCDASYWIKPSRYEEIPSDATHVVWFNR